MRQNKKIGQIFVSVSIIKKELNLINFENKTVLEIGAGDGRLTELLALKAKKVISIEKDRKYCEVLKRKFEKNKKVVILCGDFLKFPPRKVDLIIGNVPYYISSEILFHLRFFQFEKAVLMFQKEFVQKVIAKEGELNYCFLSIISQIYFKINTHFFVDKTNFTPKPKVDSIVVSFEKNMDINKKTEEMLNYFFQHKKKTLKNALIDSYKNLKINKNEVLSFANALENKNKRVFKLTKEELLDISKKVLIWQKKFFLIGEKKKENY